MSERLGRPWAASLPASAAHSVARLRLEPGIRAAMEADILWLRGEREDDAFRRAIAQVPPATIYSIGSDGMVTAVGDRLPSGPLPDLSWTPISQFVRVTMPRSLLPGAVEGFATLTLAPSDHPRLANALLTTLFQFAAWADDAPDFRFRPLRYAVSGDRVLVVGEPVPSIDGLRFYEVEGLCIPCGFDIQPPIDAVSVRTILALAATDLALFEVDRWHRIPGDALTPVSRASVRLTARRGSP
jgi:hypothetical protein